jgi:sulfide:quinone oxidoreductase
MKTFLILGAGTGGTMMANRLLRKLDPSEWKIILVDKDEQHYYQPDFLFIPFGFIKPEAVVKPKRKFIPSGIEFVISDIEVINPDNSKITLTKEKRVISYDQMLIATGTDIHPDEIDGLTGAGWRKNIFDFYTYDGAVALHDFLTKFQGGKLVINIAEMPIKCPVAPLEFAFLADYHFKKRGIRNKVDLVYTTPLPGAFTKPKAASIFSDFLSRKGIHLEPDFAVSGVDAKKNTISSWDGREIEYDLLVSVPTNMGADVIGRSGMGDDLNFVPTNKNTLQSLKWPNVWVIGDATNVPTSKAGAAIHFESDVLLENIMHAIRGEELHPDYDGHVSCFLESGSHKGVLIDFSYDVEPLPGTYPFPLVGPLSLLKESWPNHMGKLAFRWMYWNVMLNGLSVPLLTKFSMIGKRP